MPYIASLFVSNFGLLLLYISLSRIYGLCFFIWCLLFSVPLICLYIHYITLILWVMDRGKGAQIDLCDRETYFADELFVQFSGILLP